MLGIEKLSLAELEAFKAIIDGNMPSAAQIDAAAASVGVRLQGTGPVADFVRYRALFATDASAVWANAHDLARAFVHLLPDDQQQLRAAIDAAIAEKQAAKH